MQGEKTSVNLVKLPNLSIHIYEMELKCNQPGQRGCSMTKPSWKTPSASDLFCVSSRIPGTGGMKAILRSASCRASVSLLLFLLDQLDQLLPSACADAKLPDALTPVPLRTLACVAVNLLYLSHSYSSLPLARKSPSLAVVSSKDLASLVMLTS